MTLSGPRIRRLLHFAGIVKLLWSPGKAGGLPRGNYVGFKTKSRTEAPAGTVNISCEEINDKSNKKYKANKLSQLSKKEQKLVGEIYEVIRNVLPPDVVNILIYKIEERFGLNGASEK